MTVDSLGPEGWLVYLVLCLAGLVAGLLNTLAGGGSFLTIPLLIFLGLPAGVANATNRVGVWLQCASAARSFDGAGVLDRRLALWASVPATLGAILGTWLALRIGDESFERLLAVFMVVLSLASFWRPTPRVQAGEPADGLIATPGERALLAAAFFVVGIYGGFVQAGVGFLILAATSLAGLDLVRGNAVKVVSVLAFTSLSLAIFLWRDMVHWPLGLVLAVGNGLGGHLGARLTVLKGHRWLRVVVTATVLLFALKLWWS
ncbi:MAG: sulfite exporter TauE/SafE family protein [Acidobacteriota bacterium]